LLDTTFGRVRSVGVVADVGIGAATFSRNFDGSSEIYGSLDHAKGVVYQTFGLAPGDVLRYEAVAALTEYFPKLSSDPVLSGDPSLKPDSELAKLGMGYKRSI
jgi:hypothetical protein